MTDHSETDRSDTFTETAPETATLTVPLGVAAEIARLSAEFNTTSALVIEAALTALRDGLSMEPTLRRVLALESPDDGQAEDILPPHEARRNLEEIAMLVTGIRRSLEEMLDGTALLLDSGRLLMPANPNKKGTISGVAEPSEDSETTAGSQRG